MLKNIEQRERLRGEINSFLDFLSFFGRELKKGTPQEAALSKAFKVYKIFSKEEGENCVKENFSLNPNPCLFKERWREFMTMNYPNLLIIYLIDIVTEMLEIDPVETGRRLNNFLPILKNILETSESWKLLCQKPELEILKESFEIPAVISNLSIGDAWMLVFLLRHFKIFPTDLKNWKFDCSVLDSAIPIIIRNYAHKLLFFKYVIPNLKMDKDPIEIDWDTPIPIHFPCPKCRHITNLPEKDWGYIQLHTPNGLEDYHKCPLCKKLYAIRRPHIDESLWNLK